MRQPEMKRKLCRLGKHTKQHQHQHQRIQCITSNQIAAGEDSAKLITANGFANQDDPGQQCQPARASEGQRHPRPLARRRLVGPVTNQQERADAGQLPEHHQQNQVVCCDHAQHRRHKQQQQGKEPAARIILVQIVMAIDDDQQADAENQQGKQPGQTIETQCQ